MTDKRKALLLVDNPGCFSDAEVRLISTLENSKIEVTIATHGTIDEYKGKVEEFDWLLISGYKDLVEQEKQEQEKFKNERQARFDELTKDSEIPRMPVPNAGDDFELKGKRQNVGKNFYSHRYGGERTGRKTGKW